jgi:hypothetical protein
MTPSMAATAQRNSTVRTPRIAAKSPGSISGSDVTITTAARVACGISSMSGARNSTTAAVAAAVTSDATGVRAPARALTAVCDVPPPDGIAAKSPPARLAAPRASNS